jgi:hypothetical protein
MLAEEHKHIRSGELQMPRIYRLCIEPPEARNPGATNKFATRSSGLFIDHSPWHPNMFELQAN